MQVASGAARRSSACSLPAGGAGSARHSGSPCPPAPHKHRLLRVGALLPTARLRARRCRACSMLACPCRRAARKRPLSTHEARRAILLAPCAQKLSPQMNVELVASLKVFGRHADGITSQPHSGCPRWGTENIGNRGR